MGIMKIGYMLLRTENDLDLLDLALLPPPPFALENLSMAKSEAAAATARRQIRTTGAGYASQQRHQQVRLVRKERVGEEGREQRL